MAAPLLRLAALVAIAAAHAAVALAQSAPASRSFDELRQTVAQAQADTVLQIRLRWDTAEPAANPARTENRFTLVSAEQVSGSLRRDRAPQVSSTSLVAVSLDRDGRELDWRTFSDPRVVRAEATDTAELAGERLYYLEIDFLLQVPDLPETVQLRIYSVRALNGRAMLDPLGVVDVR
jgi:hypothetical protein